jgi:hypothetical protein
MMKLDPHMQRAARRMRRITLAGTVLLIAVTAFAAAWPLAGGGESAGMVQIESVGLPPVPAALVQIATGALLVLALVRLAQMLGKVEAGRPFETAAGLRGFAFYLFLSMLASLLLPPLVQLALAAAGPGGGRATFEIGSEDVLMLFVTGLLFMVARLLDEAQRVADDASQIV